MLLYASASLYRSAPAPSIANCCPDWPNAAGASVAEEYVWYGACTGDVVVTLTVTELSFRNAIHW